MRKFLRRVLGVDMLSAEVRFLSQKVRELSAEKEILELEVTHFKAKTLGISTTQAGKLQAIVKEARRQSKTYVAVA
mgnify:CR=1 FL=1